MRRLKECIKVIDKCIWQLCPQELLQYLLVAGITECNLVEVVLFHEFIEDIGTKHHRLRNLHRCVGELLEVRMSLDDMVKERQATPLSTQRAIADAGEMGETVEFLAVEHCHHANILHVAVLHDGIIDNLLVRIHVLQLVPSDVFQECRHREDGTCTEPTAHVVTRYMAQHGIVGNAENIVLQFFQVAHPHNLLVCLRISEDEITEAHVLLHDLMQVAVHRL